MILKWIFVLSCLNAKTWAIKHCCPQDKTLSPNGCSDGSKVDLDCPLHVLLDPNQNDLTVDMDGNLMLGDEIISENEFCDSPYVYNDTQVNTTAKRAIVMCYYEEDSAPLFLNILSFMSVIFLLITIATYVFLPQLMDLQGICIVHSISGLAVSFLTMGINQLATISSFTNCVALGSITYVTFLYSFFWLNILTFHIWRITVQPQFLSRIQNKWIYIYHIYGILSPLVFLVFLMIGHHLKPKSLDPGFGEGSCWFKTLAMQFAYFYGPIAALICINIFFYIWTVAFLWNEISNSDEKKKKLLIYRLKLCLKLFVIMGLSWIFEILSATFTHRSLRSVWLVTDTVNASEGILIFLVLVVFRKRVVRALANKKPFENCLPHEWRTLKDEECSESIEPTMQDEATIIK